MADLDSAIFKAYDQYENDNGQLIGVQNPSLKARLHEKAVAYIKQVETLTGLAGADKTDKKTVAGVTQPRVDDLLNRLSDTASHPGEMKAASKLALGRKQEYLQFATDLSYKEFALDMAEELQTEVKLLQDIDNSGDIKAWADYRRPS